MTISLSFPINYQYLVTEAGITIPVILKSGEMISLCTAKIDTGAQFCLFKREHGEELGLDVEQGTRLTFQTLNGSLVGFGHEIAIQTLGLTFASTIFFAQEYGLPRNLLGRHGWLQNVRLGLIDYDQMLFLSDYND